MEKLHPSRRTAGLRDSDQQLQRQRHRLTGEKAGPGASPREHELASACSACVPTLGCGRTVDCEHTLVDSLQDCLSAIELSACRLLPEVAL